MNLGKVVPAIVLIALFSLSLFFTFHPIDNKASSEFYVGVEFAYSNNLNDSQVNLSHLKELVDKVQNYTNLFITGIPEISLNQAVLNQSCDYIYKAGLHFIVLFTDITTYSYLPREWTAMAQQKYGDQFLGAYRLDEPGGIELDNVTKDRFLNPNAFSPNVKNYTGAAESYVGFLHDHIVYFHQYLYPRIFTSDYGLYWFDYKAGYDTVFAEFGWNHSRQLTMALCRGAATAHNKDWGAIITWTYTSSPYIESGQQLYSDLTLAYDAGAKYAVVFDYPNSTRYGILTEEHFEALRNFWNYVQGNPQKHGVDEGKVAYVLPEGYGFGFRSGSDSIWGLWEADDLSQKVWSDVNKLANQYGSSLDIVYNDPEYMNAITRRYDKLLFWNETIK